MNMQSPATVVPGNIMNETTCRTCLSDNMIELFDSNSKPLNYHLMLKMNNFSSFNKPSNSYASYFKCRICGCKFPILWDSNGRPVPLQTNTRINNFILNFMKEEP